MDVDMVDASYIRKSTDVLSARKILELSGGYGETYHK